MRTILNKLAIAALLSLLAISPLWAQNPASIEADTNKLGANSGGAEILQSPEALQKEKLEIDKALERTRLDNEKDLEKTRLDNEKQMANSRSDNHRSIIHDLAWNSWVIFVIAMFFFGYLKDKRRHETIRLMIEKGTPMTPELLEGLRKKPRARASYDPYGHLCWGITTTLVAGALMIAFPWGPGRTAAWIVLAVGLANLILWLIDKAYSNSGPSK